MNNKFTLLTSEDTVVASVTHAMKEVESTVALDADEEFLDDEVSSDEDSSETDKPSENNEQQESNS